jgi:hypothetical protein
VHEPAPKSCSTLKFYRRGSQYYEEILGYDPIACNDAIFEIKKKAIEK